MFSGIVQAVGRVVAIEATDAGRRMRIDGRAWGHEPGAGESVCVSGCCLTLASPVEAEGLLAFDAVPETLAKTTLGALEIGARVNLESSVTAATPMDGHVVQGHVAGVGEVAAVITSGEWRVRIAPPRDLMPCVVPKGSVAVDGVSLTIASVDPEAGWFEVALIPTTLERTTLGALQVGSKVNIETDILARTVVHVMRHYAAMLKR
jgi:riboflavin synthase